MYTLQGILILINTNLIKMYGGQQRRPFLLYNSSFRKLSCPGLRPTVPSVNGNDFLKIFLFNISVMSSRFKLGFGPHHGFLEILHKIWLIFFLDGISIYFMVFYRP